MRSPDSAFLGWVHRRTDRAVPVLCKLWEVGEGTVDSVNSWRVGVGEHLVLESCRPVYRAPDTGPGHPEELPLTVAEGREDGLGAVLLHPLQVGAVGLLHATVVGDVLPLVVDPVQVYCLSVSLGVMVRVRESL